jgi:hypothetical protein
VLILQRPWTEQPRQATELNPEWVAKGLIAAINPAARNPADTAVGTLTQTFGTYGVGIQNPNNTTVNGLTTTVRGLTNAATVITICRFPEQGDVAATGGGFGTSGGGNQIFGIFGKYTGVSEGRAIIRVNDGGGISTAEFTWDVSFDTVPAVWAATYNATAASLTVYRNGRDITASRLNTAASGTVSYDNLSANLLNRGTDVSAGRNAQNFGSFAFNRALTPSEIAELAANPWQLFQPRRIPIPYAAAAGGAPTLSDLQATNITSSSVQFTYDYAF